MKKALYILLALVAIIAVAVVAAPRLIDWNDFKPTIADAVRQATGRELVISGDLDVSLVPNIEIRAQAIQLSGARGMPVASVADIDVMIELWPLLGRTVVVERLIVRQPPLALQVDETGRANWDTALVSALSGERDDQGEARALPFADVRLGEVRIEGGALTFADQRTGQRVAATDIGIDVTMADLSQPLSLTVDATVNNEPVSFALDLRSPRALLSGQPVQIAAELIAQPVTIRLDGSGSVADTPSGAGTFTLDVPSVGALAAWLDRPLDPSLPDPGPLSVRATVVQDGTATVLEEAAIEGAAISARASGPIDLEGDTPVVALNDEGGVHDFDRYLPPPAEAVAGAPDAGAPADVGASLLAGVSNEALDLSMLRQLQGDIRVRLGGIRARGYQVGAIDVTMTARDGAVTMEISDLALYGGSIRGGFQVDAADDGLAIEANLIANAVSVDDILSATDGDLPELGIASVLAAISTRGASPLALVKNLAGEFSLQLADGELLSALEARLLLPGADEPPVLQAKLNYNAQTMRLEATLGVLDRMLSGDRFDAVAEVTSDVVRARYDGAVLQAPVPGLDGTFELDVPSVAALASWLGQPAENYDPDPGPLAVRATFAGDGANVAIEDATIEGKAIKARLSGRYDGATAVPTFEARLSIDEADLDAYLSSRGTPAADQQPAGAAAGWSDEPIDLTALGTPTVGSNSRCRMYATGTWRSMPDGSWRNWPMPLCTPPSKDCRLPAARSMSTPASTPRKARRRCRSTPMSAACRRARSCHPSPISTASAEPPLSISPSPRAGAASANWSARSMARAVSNSSTAPSTASTWPRPCAGPVPWAWAPIPANRARPISPSSAAPLRSPTACSPTPI